MHSTGAQALIAELRNAFPWVERIGLTLNWFQNVAATAASADEVVQQIRGTSQYKTRFPGLLRQDGTMRMNEAEYLSTEDNYRQVLRQFGQPDAALDSPQDFIGFFENDLDANEVRDRLTVYENVRSAGRDVSDAFYVYAGMRVSDDDLYAAVVDPAKGQQLTDEYNQRIAAQPFDYATWINRATEAGLSRVANTLGELQKTGKLTGGAIQNVLRTDSNFAAQIMDALYHGGDPRGGRFLNLNELMQSFEYAAIGAAAKGAGLEMPDRARAAEIRSAGIDRAAASNAYMDFAQMRGVYAGAVQRSTRTGRDFSQSDFEDAAFLGNGSTRAMLDQALKQEQSLGEAQGTARFDVNRTGQVRQSGLRSPR